MHHRNLILAAALGAAAIGCTSDASSASQAAAVAAQLDSVAEPYVKLALALGKHDADYVDAYYGPPEWRVEADSTVLELREIATRAAALIQRLDSLPAPADSMVRLRKAYLQNQLGSLSARVSILEGTKLTFDEESRVLYDAVAPSHPESHFQQIIDSLATLLPGTGPVSVRYERYRDQFIIPKAKLDTVFRAAIAECKARTLRHTALPSDERFSLEYVTNKSWSGFNLYQGNYKSLIQMNTDLPIHIDRAVHLACHEGYPGHHVYNVLLEQNLVKQRGWLEFTVVPLFSAQGLIAEGSANYGVGMAFPGAERVAYEKSELWPLAGLDTSETERYYRIQQVVAKLSYAGNEAARQYLDGAIGVPEFVTWMTRYALYSKPRAEQRVKFVDQYRSYVINYNLGEDVVGAYVEKAGGDDMAKRWEAFTEILTSPRLPADLMAGTN